MLGEGTSHGSSLLWPKIKGFKFLCFVELAQVLSLGLANNSQNSGNGFSHKFAAKEEKSPVRDDKLAKHHTFCGTCSHRLSGLHA